MSTEFLAEDDYTNVAVDIEASDPKALMLLWDKTPTGTRVSQTLTRSFGLADVGAFLVMVKDGVELTVALLALAKALRHQRSESRPVVAPARPIRKQSDRFRSWATSNDGMGSRVSATIEAEIHR
jgi:hypothetical protein